jgi:hypothetical protein
MDVGGLRLAFSIIGQPIRISKLTPVPFGANEYGQLQQTG